MGEFKGDIIINLPLKQRDKFTKTFQTFKYRSAFGCVYKGLRLFLNKLNQNIDNNTINELKKFIDFFNKENQLSSEDSVIFFSSSEIEENDAIMQRLRYL